MSGCSGLAVVGAPACKALELKVRGNVGKPLEAVDVVRVEDVSILSPGFSDPVPLGGVAAAPLEGAAEAAEGDDKEEDEEAE
jgi:hypothetical protein